MRFLTKSFSLILALVLVIGVFSAAPAPRAVAAGDSLAAIMPANVALYGEVDTSDLKGTINALSTLVSKFGTPMTADQALSSLDMGLSSALGRAATFDQDIQPWLGNSVAFGVPVTDEMLASPSTAMQVPPVVAVIAVKDDKAAAAFLDELISRAQGTQVTKGSEPLGADTATTYIDSQSRAEIAIFKGYIALGTPSGVAALFDTIKNNKPTLAADPDFTKVTGLLKGPNGAVLYIGKRALQLYYAGMAMAYEASASAMSAQEKQMLDSLKNLDVLNGFALATRSSDKVLAIDLAISLDQEAINKSYAQFGLPPLSLKQPAAKIADHVPGNAIAVVMWGDLAGIYKFFMGTLDAIAKQVAAGGADQGILKQLDLDQGIQKALENGLKTTTGIDLQQDFLSWADGEFALYMTPRSGAPGPTDYPFNHSLIIDASDTAKATAFVEKINGLVTKGGLKPVQEDSGLYNLAVSTAPAFNVGYGVVKNTFALTLSGPADVKAVVDAINGTNTLSSNDVWQRAKAIIGDTNQPVLFLNLTALGAFVSDSPLIPARDKAQLSAITNAFESALVYGKDYGQGLSTATLALIQK
jgi:hypothetical protein